MGNSITIVVAEADPDLQKIIAYALRPYSDDILIAHDGYGASMALVEAAPMLIVLDLNLPGLAGSDLLEQLYDYQEYSGLRVILTSSYADHEIMQQLPPASTFVQKPYDLARLRAAFDEQLAHV